MNECLPSEGRLGKSTCRAHTRPAAFAVELRFVRVAILFFGFGWREREIYIPVMVVLWHQRFNERNEVFVCSTPLNQLVFFCFVSTAARRCATTKYFPAVSLRSILHFAFSTPRRPRQPPETFVVRITFFLSEIRTCGVEILIKLLL